MGFHVALNMFSEEIETLLLNDNVLFATASQQIKNKRSSKNSGFYSVKTNNSDAPVQFVNNLNVFPDIIFKMCNLIRDCTLYPELITPDYCYANTYPSKIGFQNHIDSSYRWGASVVGISLHAPCTMCFAPKNGTTASTRNPLHNNSYPNVRHLINGTVEVELPQRSIYIMTEDSRNGKKWKHGIKSTHISWLDQTCRIDSSY